MKLFFITMMTSAAAVFAVGPIELDYYRAAAVAVRNNFDLKKISVTRTIHRENMAESWRRFLPQLTCSYSAVNTVAIANPDNRNYSLQGKLNQPLFDAGRGQIDHELVRIDLLTNHADYSRQRSLLVNQVRDMYIRVLGLAEQTLIRKTQAAYAKTQLAFGKKEFSLGVITALDLTEIDTFHKQSVLERHRVESDYHQARYGFRSLLRLPEGTDFRLAGDLRRDLIFSPPPTLNPEEMVAAAMKRREDIRNARLALLKSKKMFQVRQWGFLPDIGLEMTAGLTDDRFFPNTFTWGAAVKASFNFWGHQGETGGTLQTGNQAQRTVGNDLSLTPYADPGYTKRLLAAKLELKQTAIALEQLTDDIANAVKLSRRQLKDTWTGFQLTVQAEDAARKKFQILKLKQKLGEAKRIDLVEGRIELGKQEVATLEAVMAYLQTVTAYENALGMSAGDSRLVRIRRLWLSAEQ